MTCVTIANEVVVGGVRMPFEFTFVKMPGTSASIS